MGDNKPRKVALVLLVASIITLSIAFAMLSSKLNISGSAKLDPINWNIYFDNIDNIIKEKEAEIISVPIIDASDKRKIKNMEVTLKKPGDKVSFTVDLVNESDITAIISNIVKPAISYDFIEFKAIYTGTNIEVRDGNVINAKTAAGEERKNITISIYYSKEKVTNDDLNSISPEGLKISFNYELTFEQSDMMANMPTTTKWINGCTSDYVKRDSNETYQVGDLISFCNENKSYRNSDGVLVKGKSEDFYVIKDNGKTVTALARYNLMVGNNVIYKSDFSGIESMVKLTSSDKDYGLQSELTMMELTSDGMPVSTTLYGVTAFANKDDNNKKTGCAGDNCYLGYWANSDGSLKLGYGQSDYPADVFSESSLLYAPIKNYQTYFIGTLSKKTSNMRLITYDELVNLGCDVQNGKCTRDFLYNDLNYWSATAHLYNAVFYVRNNYVLMGLFINEVGIRPVITINKSEI